MEGAGAYAAYLVVRATQYVSISEWRQSRDFPCKPLALNNKTVAHPCKGNVVFVTNLVKNWI